jgi:hypothetical protein
MKTYNVYCQHREQTASYHRFPVGLENICQIEGSDENNAITNFCEQVIGEQTFTQKDGSMKDCDGNTIWKKHYHNVDFGDYYFFVEEEI